MILNTLHHVICCQLSTRYCAYLKMLANFKTSLIQAYSTSLSPPKSCNSSLEEILQDIINPHLFPSEPTKIDPTFSYEIENLFSVIDQSCQSIQELLSHQKEICSEDLNHEGEMTPTGEVEGEGASASGGIFELLNKLVN